MRGLTSNQNENHEFETIFPFWFFIQNFCILKLFEVTLVNMLSLLVIHMHAGYTDRMNNEKHLFIKCPSCLLICFTTEILQINCKISFWHKKYVDLRTIYYRYNWNKHVKNEYEELLSIIKSSVIPLIDVSYRFKLIHIDVAL